MKIAIVGGVQKEVFGVGVEYMEWASQFGDVAIITPDMDVQSVDLVILQGGADLAPTAYGQSPKYKVSRQNPHLEYFDKVMLPKYIEAKIPIFGICRGMQAINCHFGGTLTQHIRNHPTNGYKRDDLVHNVFIEGGCFKVNSLHHQQVDKVGKGLDVVAIDDEDKVEALVHHSLPISGVQWHPEEIYDQFSIDLVKKLLINTPK